MTVIVAARMKKGVVIAADSQTSAGWEKMYLSRSKLWTATPYVFGATGCVRTSQVVRHFTGWPKYRADEEPDLEAFTVKQVVPAIQEATKDRGVVANSHGKTYLDMSLVMAWGDQFVCIDGNGCVVTADAGRYAVGSGYAEALGYLGDKGPWTVEQVVEAARRATLTNAGCSGRIDHITTTDMTLVRGEL